jgi:hypothetical protein
MLVVIALKKALVIAIAEAIVFLAINIALIAYKEKGDKGVNNVK